MCKIAISYVLKCACWLWLVSGGLVCCDLLKKSSLTNAEHEFLARLLAKLPVLVGQACRYIFFFALRYGTSTIEF